MPIKKSTIIKYMNFQYSIIYTISIILEILIFGSYARSTLVSLFVHLVSHSLRVADRSPVGALHGPLHPFHHTRPGTV